MNPKRGQSAPQKPKSFKKAVRDILVYSKPYYPTIGVAIAASVVGVIARLVGPNKLADITNEITSGFAGKIDLQKISHIGIFLMVLYCVAAFVSFVSGVIMTRVTQKLNLRMRADITSKINRMPVGYFHTTSTGDTLSRVTNDVDLIGQTLQQSVSMLISSATLFVGCLVMMFYTDWVLALTAVVSSLIGFVFMGLIMGRTQKLFIARQKWLGELNGHVEEVYTGQQVVKLYNAQAEEKAKFDRLNKHMYEANWKSQFLSGLMFPMMGFIGNLGYVAVCVVGAVLAIKGYIGFGVIVAFMVYVRLFTNPLAQFAQAGSSLQSMAAASERVFEFLRSPEMADESDKAKAVLEGVRGDVKFKHVHFGYEPDKIIINNFNEHVLPGQKVAIVGPTGAGKTTLVNLLMRFYELNSGEILIDDVPTTQMRREEVHSLFGMVLQDTWLFEGTVRDNLMYGCHERSDEEIELACRAAGIWHLIEILPQGLDTVLDSKTQISAGQKQLLTIARTMIENAPMLILDEATSSVDTRTEMAIQKAMDKLSEGRTSFVIAHRLSTIRNADKILVMKDGDIIESGTHEQLLAAGGFYSQLYNSQFESAV